MKKALIAALSCVFCLTVASCAGSATLQTQTTAGTAAEVTSQPAETTKPEKQTEADPTSAKSKTKKPTEAVQPVDRDVHEDETPETEPQTEPETEAPEINTICAGDCLELSGTVTVEDDNSSAGGVFQMYILNLDEQFSCYLLDNMNYDGTKVYVVDSVQISGEGLENRVGEHVTVSGNVMTAHTAHHLRDIVLTDIAVY